MGKIFKSIMTKIMHGNVDRLVKALEDNADTIRKPHIEAEKAVKKLEKTIKKSKATKNLMKKTKFF